MGQWAKCNLPHNSSSVSRNSDQDLLVGGNRHSSSSHLRHSPHLTKVRCWTLWLLLIRRRPLYKRWLVRIPPVTSAGPTGSNIHSTGNNSLPINLRPNTLRLHSNNSLLRMACLLGERHSKRSGQEPHNSARPIEAGTQLPRLKCCRLRCSTPSRYVH